MKNFLHGKTEDSYRFLEKQNTSGLNVYQRRNYKETFEGREKVEWGGGHG